MMKKNKWLAAVLSATAFPLSAQNPSAISPDDLFFKMDFDSPAVVNSEPIAVSLPASGYVPGKFGKAYFFQRPCENYLPEKAAVPGNPELFKPLENATLSIGEGVLSVTGKGFVLSDIPTKMKNGYFRPTAALTCSAYVKGNKGAKMTAIVRLHPRELSDFQKKRILESYSKNKWIAVGEFKEKFRPPVSTPKTYELTGTWQRIAAYAECDPRNAADAKADVEFQLENTVGQPVQFKQFQLEQSLVHPYGRLEPTSWIPGKSVRPANETGLDWMNPVLQKNFPVEEGTISFWTFLPAPEIPMDPVRKPGAFFGFAEEWHKPEWIVCFNRIITGTPDRIFPQNPRLPEERWIHLAVTWSKTEAVYYVDGVRKASIQRKMASFPDRAKYVFSIGKSILGAESSNAFLDEFLIFKRALSEEEIRRLANAAETYPVPERKELSVTEINVPVFFRNDPDAGFFITIHSPGETFVKITVSTLRTEHFTKNLQKGKNEWKIPFNPALFTPGKGKMLLSVADASGKLFAKKEIPYEVKGQIRRDLVRILSWGGDGPVPMAYLKRLGVNAVNVSPEKFTPEYADAGMLVNLDLRNYRELRGNNFDIRKTLEETLPRIRPLKNAYNWYGTMLNSEAFFEWRFSDWDNYPQLARSAEEKLGFKPPLKNARIHPHNCLLPDPEIRFDSEGVFTPGKAFAFLEWYLNEGDMIIQLNRETAELLKKAAPGNIAWTEPPVSSGVFKGLDMGGAWNYSSALQTIAGGLRESYALVSGAGKNVFFQPTLSMYHWDNGRVKAQLNGKPYSLIRSAEELAAVSWIALGAVPLHDLCLFNAYVWYDSENKAERYLPMKGMTDTYSRFLREDFYPAALLLRDTAEPKAKVALLLSERISRYSDEGTWNHSRISSLWERTLSFYNVHYDVLFDANLRENDLSSYGTVIVPMRAKASDKIHSELLRIAKTSRLILDEYAAARYPNMIRLPYRVRNQAAIYNPESFRPCEDMIRSIASENTGRSVSATGKAGPVLYFERLHAGARYIVVVNNRWEAKGYLADCAVPKQIRGIPYAPQGVPQEVGITVGNPRGCAVFDFLQSRRISYAEKDGKAHFTVPLGPGEGRVFCIVPEAPETLSIHAGSAAGPGKPLTVLLKLNTKSTAAPQGRWIADVTVTDSDGKTSDESGFYVMEKGSASFPVRIALNARSGIWKIHAKERATGLSADFSFQVNNR